MKDTVCFGSRALTASGLIVLMISGVALGSAEDDVLERIRPIGRVNVIQPAAPAPSETVPPPAPAPAPIAAAETPAPASDGGVAVGKKTYDSVCMACHTAGVANAPKLGNVADWEPRLAKGIDALLNSVLHGVPGTIMAARGGCAACSDADLKATLDYMVSQVQ